MCPTVIIRRQFLKQVHPDFFAQFAKVKASPDDCCCKGLDARSPAHRLPHDSPTHLNRIRTPPHPQERAINGENLKLLNAVLEPSFPFPRSFPASSFPNTAANTKASPRNLTFYLKPPPPSPSPARVIVPLDGDRGAVFTALREILQAHCKELALPVLPLPPPSPYSSSSSPAQQQQQQQQPQYEDDHNRYGDAWARASANARRRQRDLRAWAAGEEARPGLDEEEENEEEEEEDDERPPPFLDLYLEAAGRREGRWGTMQVCVCQRQNTYAQRGSIRPCLLACLLARLLAYSLTHHSSPLMAKWPHNRPGVQQQQRWGGGWRRSRPSGGSRRSRYVCVGGGHE